MIIGVPREIKNHESRVAIAPVGVRELVKSDHEVVVERSAGRGCGIPDDEYVREGARIAAGPEQVYGEAEMIVKVKEPIPQEYGLLREGQVLFAFLHLAAVPELARVLLEKRLIAIAYDTVQSGDGHLPLLAPMSEVAGRLATQVGAYYLQRENGGSGVLLGSVAGTAPGRVVVIGGGTVGTSAAKVALGMGASVTVLDVNADRLNHLREILKGDLSTLVANGSSIETAVASADLLVGAVLVPGAKAPKVVSRSTISTMRPGSVAVDVSIDQGGCFATSHPTTFEGPVFVTDDVIHYCVPNLPAAVPVTSTQALTSATLPYVVHLANLGWKRALASCEALARGLNVCGGEVTCRAVADSLGLAGEPLESPTEAT